MRLGLPLLEGHSPVLLNWDAFLQLISNNFRDLHHARMAKAALRGLRQSQGIMASHAAHFRCLTVDTAWNNAMQLHQFWWDLKEEIQDEMAHAETPMGLDAFVDLTTSIDNWLRTQGGEKRFPAAPLPMYPDLTF